MRSSGAASYDGAIDWVRFLEHVHGHAGWLSAAALVHPAIVLRRKGRKAHLSVALAALLPAANGALGGWLYVAYRARLKPLIFEHAPDVGWMFERKEHLAFGTISIACAAALAYRSSWRAEDPARATLQALAHRGFVLAALGALAVACLGTWVGAHRGF